MTFTSSEMAVLRQAAAQYRGTALPRSVGARLRHCLDTMIVLRRQDGQVAGFGRDGFVVTPRGMGIYGWNEERQRQAHINA